MSSDRLVSELKVFRKGRGVLDEKLHDRLGKTLRQFWSLGAANETSVRQVVIEKMNAVALKLPSDLRVVFKVVYCLELTQQDWELLGEGVGLDPSRSEEYNKRFLEDRRDWLANQLGVSDRTIQRQEETAIVNAASTIATGHPEVVQVDEGEWSRRPKFTGSLLPGTKESCLIPGATRRTRKTVTWKRTPIDLSEDGWQYDSIAVAIHIDSVASGWLAFQIDDRRQVVSEVEGLKGVGIIHEVPHGPNPSIYPSSACLPKPMILGGPNETEGCRLERFDNLSKTCAYEYLRFVRPLHRGERHQFATRRRIGVTASHAPPCYFVTPRTATVKLSIFVRFAKRGAPSRPTDTRIACGVPSYVLADYSYGEHGSVDDFCQPGPDPDEFGEVKVEFSNLCIGLSYGLCWEPYPGGWDNNQSRKA